MQVTTERLFTEARTQNGYKPTPVPDVTLRALYELLKWGPTSANCSPARFLFVRSAPAKDKLIACLSLGNVQKVKEAPGSPATRPRSPRRRFATPRCRAATSSSRRARWGWTAAR